MKLKLTLFLSVLLMAASHGAESAESSPAKELPGIDQVLDKYVEAIGGKAAVLKVTSRLIKGTFEMPAMGLKGTAEISVKAPDKTLTVMNVPGFGELLQGYNGTVGWAKDPIQGVRELNGVELAMLKRSVDIHHDVKLKEIYSKLIVKGTAKVGDAETIVVEAVPAEGGPEKLYFDSTTGLLIRSDFDFEGPQGKIAIETYLEDYRSADGVKMPFTIRQTNPSFAIITKVNEVKSNVSMSDSKFDKPKPPSQ